MQGFDATGRRRRHHRLLGRLSALVGAVAVGAITSPAAMGGGIEVPMQNARAAGMADAFIAGADDPSAIWYNPAALTNVEGTQASVGAIGLFMDWHFDGDDGSSQSMHSQAVLPHLYLSSDLGTERLRVGIGVNNSFGLSEEWGGEGPLRFIVDEAMLSAINISPAVAYQVDDHLSLGFALNIYYADLTLHRQAFLGAPPFPEGEFRMDGQDWAVGFTPSILWEIDDRNAIGAFYRSEVSFDLHGDARVGIAGVPDVGPDRTNVPIKLPQQIGVGYAVRPTDALKVEFNVVWTDWNTFDRVRISSDNPAFDGSQIPADWRSGFTYRVGAQYDLTDHWAVRAGYAYGENAVPNATFTPIVPDSDYHLFAVGLGYRTGQWSLDLAYQLIYREDRDISNAVLSPTVDGHWENTIHTVALTATYRF